MNQAPASPSENGDSASLALLEKGLAALSEGLSILDELGMNAAAGHISLGYELAREDLQSLRNEGSSVA